MSAPDTERAAALERRYRRLLRCYPPRRPRQPLPPHRGGTGDGATTDTM